MATEVKHIDPRVKRTRQMLFQAFFELMNEKGFRAISIQDITDRATVNRATFYAHFEDKYALLDSFIRENFQQLVASKLSDSSSLTNSNLELLVVTVFDFLSQIHHEGCKPNDKQQIDPLFEEAVQQELYSVLFNWLKRVPTTGGSRRVPLETTVTAMSWAIFGSAVRWSQGTRTISKEEVAKQVMTVVMNGLPRAAQIQLSE